MVLKTRRPWSTPSTRLLVYLIIAGACPAAEEARCSVQRPPISAATFVGLVREEAAPQGATLLASAGSVGEGFPSQYVANADGP